jgi:hypothetical protein
MKGHWCCRVRAERCAAAWLLRAGPLLIVLLGVCATPAQAAPRFRVGTAATWHIQPTPTPAGAVGSVLNAVSCTSEAACIAVGYYFTTHNLSVDQMLVERWNGSKWEIQPTPNPTDEGDLTGVSCSSAASCTAVGGGENGAFAEHWNGSKWEIQTTANPSSGGLDSVSCISATACMAVGGQNVEGPFAERWNGSSWQIQPPVIPSGLTGGGALIGVSCVSSTACSAVGNYDPGTGFSASFAEHWNGSSWEIQPTPPSATGEYGLFGISCKSVLFCTAVGWAFGSDFAEPLADHWNGVSWQHQVTVGVTNPSDSYLLGVSCATTTACTAVGGNSTVLTLAERWNGTRWQAQPTPNPDGAAHSTLNDVSCTSATACTAVGVAAYNGGSSVALVETTR